MTEWKPLRVGEVAQLINGDRGKNYPSAKHRTASGIPFINAGHLDGGRVRLDSMDFIPPDRYQLLRSGKVEVDDVLLCIRGSIGRWALVTPDAVPGAIASSLVILRSGPLILPRFLAYHIASPEGSRSIMASDNGAAQPNVGAQQVASLPISLPPIDVQRRIVDVLGSIDDLIEHNRRRVQVLEEMARVIYREWFVNFRYPGHQAVPFIESAVGCIPQGWDITTLGEAAQWFSGGTPRTTVPEYWGGNLPWITSGTLTSMLLDRSDRRLTDVGAANGTRVVDRDALLFVVRGMSLAKEFRVGIADTQVAFGQDVKALVAAPDVDPMYLAFSVITRAEEIQRMVEFAGHGTGKLSTDRLQAIRLARPPYALQGRFAESIRPLREAITALRLASDRVDDLRGLLLPRLVSGQVDVSPLDPDILAPAESIAGSAVA